ncbi:hypothetical protein LOK49_LG03G00599 [Camellia lanceoleosa]|uniref:Uncharacterized protein n=1 Tax=Camellia lanceoleosa TaxID=1840588 RepID=A0ACC0I8Z8_9ERIC|nr:hypothetical protein LOK49_LG03G00599 [Camellia lanceoleosa]
MVHCWYLKFTGFPYCYSEETNANLQFQSWTIHPLLSSHNFNFVFLKKVSLQKCRKSKGNMNSKAVS